MAAMVADKPGVLKPASRDGDPGAPDAEKQREELVGDRHGVRANTVTRIQQPACATLFDRMQAIAGGCLRCHRVGGIDEAQHVVAQRLPAIELGFQKLGAYSQRVSGHLYDDLLGQDFGAEQVRKTRYTLPSDHSHLDCIAIRQGCQDGSQTLLHKIELPDRRAGLVEDLSLRQGNRIQVQKEIVESCSGQCAQDPVSDCANA